MERPKQPLSSKSSTVLIFSKNKKIGHANAKTTKPRYSTKQSKQWKRSIVANSEKAEIGQQKPYFIYEKGINYTPLALDDPLFPSAPAKSFAGLPATKPLGTIRAGKMLESQSTTSLHSLISWFSIGRRSSSLYGVGMPALASIFKFSMTSLTEGFEAHEEEEVRSDDKVPSMFRLREDPSPKWMEIETKFTVNLTETADIVLLELPTVTDYTESERGRAISELNVKHVKAMQKIQTKSTTATQTHSACQKHQKLDISRNRRANSSAYATTWDIYDTYQEQHRKECVESILIREEGQVTEIEEDHCNTEFEYLGNRFNERFLNSLMVMERLLEQRHFRRKQLLYHGLLLEDPLSYDVKCTYSLTHLWTFRSEHTKKRKVTSMCWSLDDPNILAAGYGKFEYKDKCNGLVCIWNIKNPHKPERLFEFEDPVTFMVFSQLRHQILTVTFYSGLVLLVDIINRSLMVKASNRTYPLYHPVWQAQWLPNESKSPDQYLLTCSKDGRIYRYKKTKFFISKKLMTIARPHGNILGVDQPRKCYARNILTRSHPSAEVLVLHPTDPLLYLVGTSEGCVYTCSVLHRRQHMEVFQAHNCPVYNIQFNPFCSKVFLTCGADWCIRIWAESIFEPLITLESGMIAVQDALWDPLRPTVIVSITGTFVEIWDIRRKTSTPKSSTESPTKSFNTVIKFSKNNFNLCLGDVDGHIHVLALTEMPFSPHFQEEILVQSIKNMLITRPEILEKLDRLGHPFVIKESTYEANLYHKLNKLHKVI